MKTLINFCMWMAILMVAPSIGNAQDSADKSVDQSKRIGVKIRRGDPAFRKDEVGKKHPKGIGFKVKSGNMAFVITENGKERNANFIFDENGKHFRIETGDECTIADGTTKKVYKLNLADKTYYEEDSFGVFFTLYLFLYAGDSEIVKDYPGYAKLPDRTIAGKNCTAFSYTDKSNTATAAGWKGLVFYKQDARSTFTATAFSETIPENSFVIPTDYQLVEKPTK